MTWEAPLFSFFSNLILQSLASFFYIFLGRVFTQNILYCRSDSWDKYLILNTYSIIFMIVVFGKGKAPFSGIGLNPFAFIFESIISHRVLITSLLNIMLFFPIPLLVKLFNPDISIKNQFIIGFIIAVTVELLQLIFSVGIFDISDIVLYSIGIAIGIYILNFHLKDFKKNRETV